MEPHGSTTIVTTTATSPAIEVLNLASATLQPLDAYFQGDNWRIETASVSGHNVAAIAIARDTLSRQAVYVFDTADARGATAPLGVLKLQRKETVLALQWLDERGSSDGREALLAVVTPFRIVLWATRCRGSSASWSAYRLYEDGGGLQADLKQLGVGSRAPIAVSMTPDGDAVVVG